jgi:hypothetical protein
MYYYPGCLSLGGGGRGGDGGPGILAVGGDRTYLNLVSTVIQLLLILA